ISCVDTRSFFHDPDRAARENAVAEAARALELAAALGAPGIRVFGDTIQPGQDRESTRGLIVDALARLAESAQALGVGVWIESHGDFARGPDGMGVAGALAPPAGGTRWHPANAF